MKRKHKNRQPSLILLTLTTMLIIAGVALALLYRASEGWTAGSTSTPTVAHAQNQTQSTSRTIHPADFVDTGLLNVVNANHTISLPADALRPEAAEAIAQLIAAAEQATGERLEISSDFRDQNQQALLYNQAADKSYVQLPGHSEHETGLAADIEVQNVAGALENDPASQYLAAHAWEYGLILRYPPGKEGITGISNEPWHFRYVGRVHAWLMASNQMVLEEYLDDLTAGGDYTTTLDGVSYQVSHVSDKHATIEIPAAAEVAVSSDNLGGFIVTTWMKEK